MMYDPERSNLLSLFQFFGHYLNINARDLKEEEKERYFRFHGIVNYLLNRADAVVYRLENIYQIEADLIGILMRHSNEINVPNDKIVLWAPQVNELIFEITSAILNLRLFLDSITRLVYFKYEIMNAPKSMHDFINRLTSDNPPDWVNKIPDSLKKELIQQWNQTGKKLKDYRDISQHYEILARQCFITFQNGYPVKIDVYLPDNPESKSPKDFKFQDEVSAVDLIQSSFNSLHNFLENYFKEDDTKPAPLGFSISAKPSIKADKQPGVILGINLMNRRGTQFMVFSQSENNTVSIGIRKVLPKNVG